MREARVKAVEKRGFKAKQRKAKQGRASSARPGAGE